MSHKLKTTDVKTEKTTSESKEKATTTPPKTPQSASRAASSKESAPTPAAAPSSSPAPTAEPSTKERLKTMKLFCQEYNEIVLLFTSIAGKDTYPLRAEAGSDKKRPTSAILEDLMKRYKEFGERYERESKMLLCFLTHLDSIKTESADLLWTCCFCKNPAEMLSKNSISAFYSKRETALALYVPPMERVFRQYMKEKEEALRKERLEEEAKA